MAYSRSFPFWATERAVEEFLPPAGNNNSPNLCHFQLLIFVTSNKYTSIYHLPTIPISQSRYHYLNVSQNSICQPTQISSAEKHNPELRQFNPHTTQTSKPSNSNSMYRNRVPRLLPIPSALHSQSTLILSSGLQYAQSRPLNTPLSLSHRSEHDQIRASLEVECGLVKEHEDGDWVLVKWVASRHPVFTVHEILVMAIDIVSERSVRYQNTNDLEELLMWILEDLVSQYTLDNRVLDTLVRCNVRNRYRNIIGGSNTLD